MNSPTIDLAPTDWNGQTMQKRIAARYAAERRFKAMGFFAVALSTIFLAFLLFTMLSSDNPDFDIIALGDYADGIAARVTGQYSRLDADAAEIAWWTWDTAEARLMTRGSRNDL